MGRANAHPKSGRTTVQENVCGKETAHRQSDLPATYQWDLSPLTSSARGSPTAQHTPSSPSSAGFFNRNGRDSSTTFLYTDQDDNSRRPASSHRHGGRQRPRRFSSFEPSVALSTPILAPNAVTASASVNGSDEDARPAAITRSRAGEPGHVRASSHSPARPRAGPWRSRQTSASTGPCRFLDGHDGIFTKFMMQSLYSGQESEL